MKKLILLLAALTIAPFSFAQTSSYAGLDHINRIIANTPGVTVATISGDSAITAVGNVAVTTADGLKIPVPTSIVATVGKASLAAAAVKFIPYVGYAVTAAQIYNMLHDATIGAGYVPCPSGVVSSVGCAPDSSVPAGSIDPTQTGWVQGGYWGGAYHCQPGMHCTADMAAQSTAMTNCGTLIWMTIVWDSTQSRANVTCKASSGYVYPASPISPETGVTPRFKAIPLIVPASSQVQSDLQNSLSKSSVMAAILYNAMRADMLANPSGVVQPADVVPAASPVAVVANPVTSPETVVKVQTIPNADGSTSTETTKSATTVTPVRTGTTVGDTAITYNTSNTTTVTNVNNTTNVTTTNTTTTTPKSTPNDTADPCEAHPERSGCSALGTPPAAELVPTQVIPVTVSPVTFASNASCPAPVTYNMGRFGGAQAISWQPFCDWTTQIRAVFLACFAAATAWIFLEGMKGL